MVATGDVGLIEDCRPSFSGWAGSDLCNEPLDVPCVESKTIPTSRRGVMLT